MVITYDKNGRVISRCRNLRYALEKARRVPVARVIIVPRKQSRDPFEEWALVQLSWDDGAYTETVFASFEVAKALYEGKARRNPRWPRPVFNY